MAREGEFIELNESSRNEDVDIPRDVITGDLDTSFIRNVDNTDIQLPQAGTTDLGVSLELPPGVGEAQVNKVEEALQMAVKSWRTRLSPTEAGHRFILEKSGRLWVRCRTKNRPLEWVPLNYLKGNKLVYYVPKGIEKAYGTAALDDLKVRESGTLPPEFEAAARETLNVTQDAMGATDVNLPQAGSNLSTHIRQLIAGEAFADRYTRALGYENLRDLAAGAKFLETARGTLVATQGKMRQLDILIEHRQEKIKAAQGLAPEVRKFQEKELETLREERTRQYAISLELSEGVRNQIGRIHETLYKMLNYDTTLRERLTTLFKEQGITIVSILTAIGMCISTLVLAITRPFSSAAPPPPGPPPPPPGPGLKEWIKQRMLDLGQLLLKLGEKAAAAVPGIIGSIISWLLRTLGKAAVWVAGNIWALAVALGGLLILALREYIKSR